MTPPDLPKWPDRWELQPMTPALVDVAASQVVYERARAEAAIARLRVAVEVLTKIADHCTKQGDWRFDSIEDAADVTLARIGPLPPEPRAGE